MSDKDRLRETRSNTIINATSRTQETNVVKALNDVVRHLNKKFDDKIVLRHEPQWLLAALVDELTRTYPEVDFHHHFHNTSIRPDGGILFLEAKDKAKFTFPVLIAEVKNQGTNDRRASEGLSKQAKGNAIERLGKNLIGLRTALMRESIFPFVCFGYGCDFESDSTILDRVSTMAMFGHLNKTYLHNQDGGRFNRGSFYFRPKEWSVIEMAKIMADIAERSVLYYFSKYGQDTFI